MIRRCSLWFLSVVVCSSIHAGEGRRPIYGPVVITEVTATTVVPLGWQACVLCDGSLLLERVS